MTPSEPHGREESDEFSWADAYNEIGSTWPYVRVPLPFRTVEPMEDYDFPTFMAWLDLTLDYHVLIKRMRSRCSRLRDT